MTLTTLTALTALTCLLSCYPVYDGPVPDLGEQQSVWQYLSVYSIYQESVPPNNWDLSPKEMFDRIADTMSVRVGNYVYGGRFTDYYDDPAFGAAAGVSGAAAGDADMYESVSSRTAYLHLSEFSTVSWAKFKAQLPFLRRFDNIVVDLRGNLGGLLNVTDSIVGEFVPYGANYIHTRRRSYDSKRHAGVTVDGYLTNSKRSPTLTGKKISVITDKLSASASELLAAALKDCVGANLVGDTTFGKGIGQIIATRMGRQTIRITFMEIEGITERTGAYHKKGIAPDTVPPDIDEKVERYCPKRYASQGGCDRSLYEAVWTIDPDATGEEIERLAGVVRDNGVGKKREVGAYLVLEEELPLDGF